MCNTYVNRLEGGVWKEVFQLPQLKDNWASSGATL
jgi:hypothetical protein